MTRLTDSELARIEWSLRADDTFCQTALPDTTKRLVDEARLLRAAIREHRDQRGDDRCWLDDERLYQALPEGYTPPRRDAAVELALCAKFIACRHNPGTEYVSPQRRIEELEAEVKAVRLEERLRCARVCWQVYTGTDSTADRVAGAVLNGVACRRVAVPEAGFLTCSQVEAAVRAGIDG